MNALTGSVDEDFREAVIAWIDPQTGRPYNLWLLGASGVTVLAGDVINWRGNVTLTGRQVRRLEALAQVIGYSGPVFHECEVDRG